MVLLKQIVQSLMARHRHFSLIGGSAHRTSILRRYTTSNSVQDLPNDANVVIIGGGAVGTSLAYHLAKQGCESVLLLEMTELTAGSTWHAAGIVTSYHPLGNVKPIHKYSLDLFSQLERETGQAISLHCSGSLRLAATEERAEEMRYQVSRNRTTGYPIRLVTPAEIQKLCPLLQPNQIKLGVCSFDGHVDPYSLTQAYAKGARSHGAKIQQQVRVTGLSMLPGGGWRVDTTRGSVNADKVVNAAGFYAKDVGVLSGISLPLVAVEHQYVVTAQIPDVLELAREIPILRYMEASSYIRMERGGLLVGVYEEPEKMKLADKWFKEGVPQDFSKQLYEPDLERSESYLSMVMDLIPCLKTAQIQSVVNGPITYTPDGLPMVGPHTLPDMWLAVGFGFGIIHSGGVGKYLADYIQSGEPPAALPELDPGRYRATWTTDDYVLAKARESYGLLNATSFPHDEKFAGRPGCRVSSAMPLQQQRGARFLPHAGWEQPAWFAGIGQTADYKPAFTRTNWHAHTMQESMAVSEAAGIIDLTPFGKFTVSGSQAAELLSRVTANTLPAEGKCVVTHALTSRGTIYAELTVSRTSPDSFLVVTGSGSEVHDYRWLAQKARKWGLSKVTLANVTEDFGCLSVAGPKARDVLRDACSSFPETFPFFGFREVTVGDVPVRALRLSYTGEDGWELYHPRQLTGHLYQALLDAGEQKHSLRDFGTHALNVLRLEKGFRGWGAELTVDRTMVEAGMMTFVDLKKGDFEGRSAVLEQLSGVPERRLVQVALLSPKLDPMGDEAVWANGAVVGSTTSGCYSPALGKSLAFCYLPPFLTVPGTEVQVEILSELHVATVLSRPPVATHRARTKSKKTTSV